MRLKRKQDASSAERDPCPTKTSKVKPKEKAFANPTMEHRQPLSAADFERYKREMQVIFDLNLIFTADVFYIGLL